MHLQPLNEKIRSIFSCRQKGILLSWILCINFLGIQAQQSPDVTLRADSLHTPIPECIELLSKYIQIPSITGDEGDAGKFLMEQCLKKGLHVRIFSDQKNQYNFAASLYPLESGLPNIIFLNHIDVVPTGPIEDWKYEPFSGRVDSQMVYGRGTIDMKGMAIMQLEAISEFKQHHEGESLQFNVTLLSVSGEEEFGTKGAGWVVSNFLKELNPVAVFNEGGSGVYGILSKQPEKPLMCISIAEKKALWLELEVRDLTSGHGSVPPFVYANKTAMIELNRILGEKPKIILNDYTLQTLKSLGSVESGLRGYVFRHIKLFKPLVAGKLKKDPLVMSAVSNTITLTNINNPAGSTNQIAQQTTATLDCRLLPGYPAHKFLAEIRKKINHKNTTIEVINQSQEAQASPLNKYYYRLSDALKKVYPDCDVIPILFPAVTDNNS